MLSGTRTMGMRMGLAAWAHGHGHGHEHGPGLLSALQAKKIFLHGRMGMGMLGMGMMGMGMGMLSGTRSWACACAWA